MCKEKWIVPSLSVEGINCLRTGSLSIENVGGAVISIQIPVNQLPQKKSRGRPITTPVIERSFVDKKRRWLLGEQDRGSQKSQHRPPRRTVVTDIGYDVFFWKGLGSHPSGFSARCTRSTENTDQKVSIVNPGSLLANACYARAAIC